MIKSSIKKSLNTISAKFTLIYILNCLDILFTYTLLKTGSFYEANFIMRPVVSNPYLCILVKVLFPAALILGLLPHLQEEKTSSIKTAHFCTNIVLWAYMAINILHIYYTIKLFSFL